MLPAAVILGFVAQRCKALQNEEVRLRLGRSRKIPAESRAKPREIEWLTSSENVASTQNQPRERDNLQRSCCLCTETFTYGVGQNQLLFAA